jgi:hypothetical protein
VNEKLCGEVVAPQPVNPTASAAPITNSTASLAKRARPARSLLANGSKTRPKATGQTLLPNGLRGRSLDPLLPGSVMVIATVVAVEPDATVAGLKLAVMPSGRLLTLKVTAAGSSVPFVGVITSEYTACPPGRAAMAPLPPAKVSVKSCTVSVIALLVAGP